MYPFGLSTERGNSFYSHNRDLHTYERPISSRRISIYEYLMKKKKKPDPLLPSEVVPGDKNDPFLENLFNAIAYAIEFEAGVGVGIGGSTEIGGIAEIKGSIYADNFTFVINDGASYFADSMSAGIGVTFFDLKEFMIGIEFSSLHPYAEATDCRDHSMWSAFWSIALCEYAEKGISSIFSIKNNDQELSADSDFVLGIGGACHTGVGVHYSFGININEVIDYLSNTYTP